VARSWCEGLAQRLRVERIRPTGEPYLDRYYAAGWNPITKARGPAVFLHHFLGSDPANEVHSHPWTWAVSILLVGGYEEQRCDAGGYATIRRYWPGEVNVLEPQVRHRIHLLTDDCWTLFLAGDFQQAWSFHASCGV
jgi:hypothetical protein